MPRDHILKTQTRRARELRKDMTTTEVLLWMELKNHKLGVKFRRQVPIGPYVVDFLCSERGLVVELDGGQHVDGVDDVRDRYLESKGYQVLRIWNSIVRRDMEEALIMINNRL